LVTVGYGLRNLADWRGGLDEMWRVLRPGGRLVVLDFGKPANGLWRAVYYGYLRCCAPCLGDPVEIFTPAAGGKTAEGRGSGGVSRQGTANIP
jgi:ubiquinone/menaquinone biosynthesis C-methylase UbiE